MFAVSSHTAKGGPSLVALDLERCHAFFEEVIGLGHTLLHQSVESPKSLVGLRGLLLKNCDTPIDRRSPRCATACKRASMALAVRPGTGFVPEASLPTAKPVYVTR